MPDVPHPRSASPNDPSSLTRQDGRRPYQRCTATTPQDGEEDEPPIKLPPLPLLTVLNPI
jgi:hypothetical protein